MSAGVFNVFRRFILALILLVMLVQFRVDPVQAAGDRKIDFSVYPVGTPISAINIPGITFIVPNGATVEIGYGGQLVILGNNGVDLRIVSSQPYAQLTVSLSGFGGCGSAPDHFYWLNSGVQVGAYTSLSPSPGWGRCNDAIVTRGGPVNELQVDTTTGEGTQLYYLIFSDMKTLFTDGRCNQQADQAVTVYPMDDGGYNFFAVNKGIGYFAMKVTKAELDTHPDKGVNYLIKEARGVRLYRLNGGKLQVNRVKPDGTEYAYIFPPCE